MFAQGVKRYIGSYIAEMNGVDCIVFTAGVGENDWAMREMIMQDMDALGIDFDFEKNRTVPRGEENVLSKPESKVLVMVLLQKAIGYGILRHYPPQRSKERNAL